LYKSLKSNQEIQRTLQNGLKVVSKSFAVFVVQDADLERVECAFAAGKKSFKTAVLRNRVKRKLREAFRSSDLVKREFRYVVMGRLPILEKDKESIIKEMNIVLEKICQD